MKKINYIGCIFLNKLMTLDKETQLCYILFIVLIKTEFQCYIGHFDEKYHIN